MAYEIAHLETIGAIEIKAAGAVDANSMVELIIELATALNATGFQRALLDFRRAIVTPDENVSELLGVVTLLGDMGVEPSVRLTGIVARETPYFSYFENAASSIGYDMRFFTDKAEALNWLASSGAT
jgi:hypothetical protein